MDIELNILKNWIEGSDNIVFITGKDFSAEAGFPDYRAMDEDFLDKYKYPPDDILCLTFLQRCPMFFYRYYRDKILTPVLNAQPSPAHEALAKLEESGKLKAILTVNIDGIHQEAGSKEVVELHGLRDAELVREMRKVFGLFLYRRQPHAHPLLQRGYVRRLCAPCHRAEGGAL